jgi:hypothetical protein
VKKAISISLGALAILYAVLLLPETNQAPSPNEAPRGPKKAFAWNQDDFWSQIEARYVAAKSEGCEKTRRSADSLLAAAKGEIVYIKSHPLPPDDPAFRRLENLIFRMGSLAAPCVDRVPAFKEIVAGNRTAIKRQSEQWDMRREVTRETLYRLLYGSRGALEEVLLHLPSGSAPDPLTPGTDEPSQTPWASILGVKIHSGDILVSRGGAATSALIARGNDFPGNFSHIALVYVDPKTHLVSIIEAHIEKGVAVATPEQYLNDTKLRVMVLRLRNDMPQLRADSMLPHNAAEWALRKSMEGHIPYDFSMDFQNPDKWFCSEVASLAYATVGVRLWMGLSHVSSPGLRSWLGAFGVEHFETQEPSDLEYDPQLRVVAEWRDPEQLRKDHYDNAVTEAMLEGAEAGERLTYPWYMLPVGRAAKAYSVILNTLGEVGPVPEGMTASAALRNRYYSDKHAAITRELARLAEDFERHKGYAAPYWGLLQMARAAKQTIENR